MYNEKLEHSSYNTTEGEEFSQAKERDEKVKAVEKVGDYQFSSRQGEH